MVSFLIHGKWIRIGKVTFHFFFFGYLPFLDLGVCYAGFFTLGKFIKTDTYGFCIFPIMFYALAQCLFTKLLPEVRKAFVIEFNFIVTTEEPKLLCWEYIFLQRNNTVYLFISDIPVSFIKNSKVRNYCIVLPNMVISNLIKCLLQCQL